ncbi:Arginine--tRNA ligase 1 [Candidatus Zixiibacteriota bacterium]|nr:Arginine--tRNA ligase 1 [candidate division Zixibacteria bacterium]
MADNLRQTAAKITAEAFMILFPDLKDALPHLFAFHAGQIYDRMEAPKNPKMGNYALPLFEIAKSLKKNPVELNKELVEKQTLIVQNHSDYSHFNFEAVGGFNNVRVRVDMLAEYTLGEIINQGREYGSSEQGKGKTVVIDFSSPNIAKPFGVGHLRSTAIGNALYRIYKKLGHEVIGINHLGDWGTQFGKMIVAYRKWGNESQLKNDPVRNLYELYVRFHREEKGNPALADEGREAFKALEEGQSSAVALWQKFKDYSLEYFQKIYAMLGVHFDFNTGESFYNDKMEPVIERLQKAGLTTVSEGALIVPLEEYGLPPCLLKRADGATLYATRDLAGILYRSENFHFDKALYVVNTGQRIHFRQVFTVIELLEEAERIPLEKRIAHRLIHVEFGWIKFDDAVMSTREGNIIFLEEVLDKATRLAKEKILEKNPDLKEVEKTARQIGNGAVIFADLSTRKEKDVNFDWDKVLSFEGETGPYLQYTHARLSSLLRHYGKNITGKIDYSRLNFPEEGRVIELIYKFPETIAEAASGFEPFIIVSYLLELAAAFNKIYQRKDEQGRIDKIISDDIKLTEARMALVHSVRIVIEEGLYLLGLEAPHEM